MSHSVRFLTLLGALAAAGMPAPVLAQDGDASLERMQERLSDPAQQQQIASTLGALSEILLSMPIAPMIEAVEEATGEELAPVGPDTTLRSLAGPRADTLSRDIEQHVPRAMEAMAGMTRGMQAMLPALREMADRMRAAIPSATD